MRQSLALAISLLLFAAPSPAQDAREVSVLRWSSNVEGFGGISGLALADDGLKFTFVTDHGKIGQGKLDRSDGKITGVSLGKLVPLLGPGRARLSTFHSDAEEVVIRPDGRIYVSFERYHRVWTYAEFGGEGAWLPRHPDFAEFGRNSGLEALARDKSGALFAIPEAAKGGLFPVYRYERGKWSKPYFFNERDGFQVTSADFGPDGRLYVLERDFGIIRGFTSRLRRFEVTPDGLTREQILLTTRPRERDNLEGLSVWRAPDGLRATMISDDNFRALQRTEIVEYALPD